MDANNLEPHYTIHYTDNRGEAHVLPVYVKSLLAHFISSIQAAEGHRIDRIKNHAA